MAQPVDATCRLCFKLRRDCECIAGRRGGKQIDDFHPAFAIAHEYIREEMFFGKEKHKTALELLKSSKAMYLEDYIQSHGRNLEGFERMRLDKDDLRLERMADGRLFATMQKMRDRRSNGPTTQGRAAESSREVIARFKAARSLPQAT
jgi:hypothetical protein